MPQEGWRTYVVSVVVLLAVVFVAFFGAYSGVKRAANYGRPPIEQTKPTDGHNSNPADNDSPAPVALTRGSTPTTPLYVEPTCDDQDRGAECNKGWWQRLWTDPVATFTGLLFIATFFQAIFTIAALVESRNANRAAARAEEKTTEALIGTNRAFVYHKGNSNLAPNTDSEGHLRQWTFFPILENSGNTPTHHMIHHLNLAVMDSPHTPEEIGFPDLWSPGMPQEDVPLFLGPKATTWGATLALHVVDLDGVLHGRKRIFMWGWVDYNDIFPNTPRHRTEFCNEVFVLGDPTNPAHITFRTYRAFNGADDECYRPPKPYVPPRLNGAPPNSQVPPAS